MRAHLVFESARACALAIGGLDPGGGAGIGADLRAFAAAGAFGCAAVAAITVQSTAGLRSVRAIAAREVVAQVEEVLRNQRVRAVKVGALASEANVRAVADLARRHAGIPFVVDTPMLPSRAARGAGRGSSTRGGARLLSRAAVGALRERLLPRAALVTVNVAEAEALAGAGAIRTPEEARDAARALLGAGARAVLVKGGHLRGPRAVDVLAVGDAVFELAAKRLALLPVHGTGCTLASLVAGRLARRPVEALEDGEIVAAVRWAKRTHHAALRRTIAVGTGMRVVVFEGGGGRRAR